MLRRHFFRIAAAGAIAASPLTSVAAASRKRPLKKGLMYGTFRSDQLSVREKFDLLKAAGFDGVEMRALMDQREVLAARDATGLIIPSVVVPTNWTRPLSDPNPVFREAGLEGLKQALRDAKAYGATSVLLVPAVVNKTVSYAEAYDRSVTEIKKAIPLAEELGVAIAIENVWNQFLFSPLEMAAYIDSFRSPMMKSHFDVGNVVRHGWPEQWIRVLGSRIVKVHVKEYSRTFAEQKGPRAGFDVELFKGDSDWPAVMKAFDEIHYDGWLITEQPRPRGLDDAGYLAHLSGKLDDIIAS